MLPSDVRTVAVDQGNAGQPGSQLNRRSHSTIYTPVMTPRERSALPTDPSTFSATPSAGNLSGSARPAATQSRPIHSPAAGSTPADALTRRNLTEDELHRMTHELWGTAVECVGHGIASGPNQKIWRDPVTPNVLKIYHPQHGISSARDLTDAIAQLRAHGTLTRADLHQQNFQKLAALVKRDFGDAVRVLERRPATRATDRVEIWPDQKKGGISGRTSAGRFHVGNYAEAFKKLMGEPSLLALRKEFERGLEALRKSVQNHWKGQVSVSDVQPPLDHLPITIWPLVDGGVGLHGRGYEQVVLSSMQEVEQVLKSRGFEPGLASPKYVAAIFNQVAAQYWGGKVKVGEPKHGELHRHPRVWLMNDGSIGAKLHGQPPQLHLTADGVERYLNANRIFSDHPNLSGSGFSALINQPETEVSRAKKPPLLDRLADRIWSSARQVR